MAGNEHGRTEKATGAAPDVPPLTEAEQRQIRVLKAVVSSLGVLIVLGLGALLAGVILKGGAGSRGLPAGEVMRLPVPKGAVVEDMRLSGNVLALRLKRAGGGGEIVVLDARRGRVLRRIRLAPRD